MNKHLAGIVDSIALWNLHRQRSKTSYFKNSQSPIAIEQLNNFYSKPGVPEIRFEASTDYGNFETGRYKYASEIQSKDTCNNTSQGTYYKYKSGAEKLNVILVHGWRMNSRDRIDAIFLKPFLSHGYNIYHFTLPYHFDRNPAYSAYNGELMISANIDITLECVRQAVTDLRALIYWIKANSSRKVLLIGVSLGGFITNLTSVVEREIDALASVMYANSIAYSVWHTICSKP